MFMQIIRTTSDPALTVLRLTLGMVFLAHGSQKMLGWFGGEGFSRTVEAFSGMGIPEMLVPLIIFAEFFGGIGLIVGFLGRIAAAGIIAVMAGAVAIVHLDNGFFMNWTGMQPGEGFEFHLLAIAIAVAIVIHGAGALSLDRAISRRAAVQAEPRRRAVA
jgi:putative oxidoreductase